MAESDRPLAGARVLVTRMSEQGGRLRRELQDLGAEVVAVPTIAVDHPSDGGAALRDLLARIDEADWLVVTSPNGAKSVFGADMPDAIRVDSLPASLCIAAVGPGTRDRLQSLGVEVDFVPPRAIAESLVDHFPAPSGNATVLLPQAEIARPVVAVGLRASGWTVHTAAAYRTIDATISDEQVRAVSTCNAVTFTSGSTVDRFVSLIGASATPPVVACIGPITAASAAAHDIDIDLVADEHTIDGLVAALASFWLNRAND